MILLDPRAFRGYVSSVIQRITQASEDMQWTQITIYQEKDRIG